MFFTLNYSPFSSGDTYPFGSFPSDSIQTFSASGINLSSSSLENNFRFSGTSIKEAGYLLINFLLDSLRSSSVGGQESYFTLLVNSCLIYSIIKGRSYLLFCGTIPEGGMNTYNFLVSQHIYVLLEL